MKIREGIFENPKGKKVWYQVVGDNDTVPLIVLHGGPGYPHDSLKLLDDLTDERNVIYYDQLGCGNSQKVRDKSILSVDLYVNELMTLIKELGLKQYHILGHSWGSALAVSLALTKPKGLNSLILADPYLSTPHWEKDSERLVSNFTEDIQEGIRKNDKLAVRKYYTKHVLELKDRPVEVIKSQNKMNFEVYECMWGENELKITGKLKDLDLSGRLRELEMPVLYLCGRNDEATPETIEYFRSVTPNAKIKIFENSAHNPHWTEREEYIKTVRKFLNDN